MAGTILGDAQTASNWTSEAGALEGVLRFLGLSRDRETVMVLSGHAFRLSIGGGGGDSGGIADQASANCFDRERALTLYENLGYRFTRIGARFGEPEYDRRREEALRAMRRSIDRGRPVATYGLQVPEFGVVKGYDEEARLLYVSTTVSPQYGEALPVSQWPAPGKRPWIEVLLPGERRTVEGRGRRGFGPWRRAEPGQDAAVSAALTFAVQYAEQGDAGGPAGVAHGLAAYTRWLEGYAQEGALDRAGNARCIQTVQAARRDAATFLRRLADSHPAYAAASAALRAAAGAYEREALAFSRLASLFPYPNGGDPFSAGALAVGALGLREALAQEREAVAALKAAIAAG